MAEILAVTWSEAELMLRRVPSEGIWNREGKPLKRVPLPRPTRTGRLAHPEIGGAFGVALTELFVDVDVNVPCWLLLPNNWTLRFISEPPEFKSQEQTLNHLRWESKQRISGDPADYKISAALLMGGARYFICITRTEVIQRCLTAAESAELDFAGIGLEPNQSENYTFEHPLDLRDALPLEVEPDKKPFAARKKVSPVFIGVFSLIVIAAVVYSLSSSKPEPVKKPVVKKAESKPMIANESVTPPPATATPKSVDTTSTSVKPESSPPPTVAKIAEAPATPLPEVKTISGGSIIRGVFTGLPSGARIELAVLSPVDLKIEAGGISSPDQWLTALKKNPGWATAKVVGNYETIAGKVTAVRIENSGWTMAEGKPASKWEELAKSSGMSVKGKTATGKLDSALNLLDRLWKDSSGLSKIYLAPSGDQWQIVVQ